MGLCMFLEKKKVSLELSPFWYIICFYCHVLGKEESFYFLNMYTRRILSFLHGSGFFFALNCGYFLIHWVKHVFGVLKRTVSLRRFLGARLIKTVLLSTHNICFG